MGMRIDETRSHHLACGINNLGRIFGNTPNFDDNVVFDTHIGDIGWQATTVDHLAILDH